MSKPAIKTDLGTAYPTEEKLCLWLGSAAPGDRIVYHRGYLPLDIAPTAEAMHGRPRMELARVARRALFAAEHGMAHLLQQRHGPGDYSYLLVAAARRWVP
jgi:hypothetical protein